MNFKRFHESKNLFDEIYPSISGTITYRALNLGNGTYTLSSTVEISSGSAGTLFFLAGNVSSGASTATNAVYDGRPITVTSTDGYVTIAYRTYTVDTPVGKQTMLNVGETAKPYEPYSSEVWHDIPYYQHKTATDTLTLPAVIYPNDTSITVGIKGNTTQSGTPTPDTPVTPQGTGDMTENLFDENNMDIGYWIASNGIVSSATYGAITNKLPLNNLDMTVYFHGTIPYSCSICWYHGSSFISRSHVPYNVIQAEESFTAPNNADSFIFQLAISSTGGDTITQEDINSFKCMMNEGSTPLPYEPYGYKIPILSNSTTTPVYLGEVESTRNIKQLVLDGTGGSITASGRYRLTVSDKINITPICTHYKGSNVTSYTELNDGEVTMGISSYLTIYDSNCTTLNEYQTYLQQQYANGTPVCVWYVLATEETGIVNEPLRKIGDYADEVSGITIPTIAGANTILIGTTLQPSEVSVNYKGWHPVQSVHERESGAWD